MELTVNRSRLIISAVVVGLALLGACGDDADETTAAADGTTTSGAVAVTAATDPPPDALAGTTPTADRPSMTAIAGPATCQTTSFRSGGRDIPAERCAPSAELVTDAGVIVLGGCESHDGDLPFKREVAESLAAAGLTALIVDYHAAAPAPDETYCEASETALAGLPAILAAVSDARAWLSADVDVDGGPIAAIGYSLGGLLAMWAEIGGGLGIPVAPVDLAGIAMFSPAASPDVLGAAGAGRLPPLFVVHGDLDDVVPIDASRQLKQAVDAGGTEMTLEVVAQMDHGWAGNQPNQVAARENAIPVIVDFVLAALENVS